MLIFLLHSLLLFQIQISTEYSSVTAVKFDFGTLTLTDLKLLGDAHLSNGSIHLSRDLPVPASGSGRALYSHPIRVASPFSTFFSFSITTINPSSSGAGLAFLLASDSHSIGEPGPHLGLLASATSSVVAIEFDTLMDVQFNDINSNHIGIDINSLVSSDAADLDLIDIDLKSGDLINAWIEYSGSLLHVFVSYSTLRPEKPVLSFPLDLQKYFNKFAFVGFSAATQGSTEVHSVEWWSFSSSPHVSPPVPPPAPPASFNVASQLPPVNALAPEIPKNDSFVTSPLPSLSHRGPHPAAVAGMATAGAFFGLAFAGVGFWFFFTRRRKQYNLGGPPSELVNSPREFTYRELSSATQSFDSGRIIGHGAFGTVYKGIIPETGSIVAIKRFIRNPDNSGRAEFLSELSIIAGLRHRNLLRLHGWCHDRGEILLVYDYMPHSSLDKALFDPDSPQLPFRHRKRILTGIASALAYLHRECERQVIHRDVKSSNVMLDDSYNARLGDFGLARELDHGASPDATVTAGTMGYLAPEYLVTGRATEKTDVFSFGTVVLEVVCGRRPIDGCNNLVEWVWGLHSEGRILESVDRRLEGGYEEAEMRAVMMVGLACSSPDPVMRPGMRGVVQMLSGEMDPPLVPVAKPAMSTNEQLLMSLEDSMSDSTSSDSLESTLRGGGRG